MPSRTGKSSVMAHGRPVPRLNRKKVCPTIRCRHVNAGGLSQNYIFHFHARHSSGFRLERPLSTRFRRRCQTRLDAGASYPGNKNQLHCSSLLFWTAGKMWTPSSAANSGMMRQRMRNCPLLETGWRLIREKRETKPSYAPFSRARPVFPAKLQGKAARNRYWEPMWISWP